MRIILKYKPYPANQTIKFLTHCRQIGGSLNKKECCLKKSQPIAITTDNGSNYVFGINSISSKCAPDIRCFAQTLNSAIKKAMKCQYVNKVAGIVRRIVFSP
jgi:hypothetical protein